MRRNPPTVRLSMCLSPLRHSWLLLLLMLLPMVASAAVVAEGALGPPSPTAAAAWAPSEGCALPASVSCALRRCRRPPPPPWGCVGWSSARGTWAAAACDGGGWVPQTHCPAAAAVGGGEGGRGRRACGTRGGCGGRRPAPCRWYG